MDPFKKLTVIWLVLLILLTVKSPSYGYNNEAEIQTVLLAESLIGKPFKQGGNTPEEGFDSTGFIQYVFREEGNIVLPGSPSQLWKLGEPIERSEIQPGDVLFFTGSDNLIPAIYKGDNIIIVIATNEGVVKRDIVEDSYWRDRYKGTRRYTNIANELNPVAVKALEIVEKAMDLLGTPYNPEGKSSAKGFNTTNFVRYVFKKTLDIQLSVFSDRIYEVGESISKEDLQLGDLVFFQGSSLIPGIYRGNGMFIVQTTEGVAERDIESEYWSDIYVGAKRLTEADIYYSQPENYRDHENVVIREAMKYIGTPYLLGGETTDGFDCSYLVQTVFRDAKKIYLPRITYKQAVVGETIDFENKRPGDVIYFKGKSEKEISHAAIYLGNNYIIHASGDEGMTTISYLGPYWLGRLAVVKRFDSLSLRLDSKVVEEAYKTLGIPYLAGGNTKEGFDYSGFIQYVMKAGLDIDLPRYSSQQWALGKEIEREDLNIGDVLFFQGSNKVLLPGLYIGNEQFMIVTESEGVAIRDLNISDSYWTPRYVGARRYEKINSIGQTNIVKPTVNPLIQKNVSKKLQKTLGIGIIILALLIYLGYRFIKSLVKTK
ncbi:cell wall-associated NlpC family hydrolase [Anaerosolibacter carboniphilus]|uniref:Cell wall-associated NlpC family hydrolase n=1 Tax=Anaerosolibacter carboniphilus TaxID=1417629 RepID=A0A841KYC3_9FIRM|nr:NlpC/P60 family protein [Anaerosolibacter carboniphilus]MBB6218343.1 cell wall-associated NlpC family hydrolase [Anaerosolibacter carboniphilus]